MGRMTLSAAMLLLLAGCEEPFIVFPGGELSGEQSAVPEDWSQLVSIDTVQLETRMDNPYSVNIWAAGAGKDLYVATGEDGTNWTEHIADDPAVRLRSYSYVYALSARLVEEPSERARAAQAFVGKYDLEVDDNWVLEGMIFRLDRR